MTDLKPDDRARLRRAFRFMDDEAPLAPDLSAIAARARASSRHSTWIAFGTAALVTAVVAIAVILRPPEAQAFWAPVPSTPDAALVAAAPELCRDQQNKGSELQPLVLIDQRADAARVIFGTNGSDTISSTFCTLIRLDGVWVAPPLDELSIDAYTVTGAWSLPSEIETVVIDQVDGVRVEAATSEGFYHFWWPSPETFPGGTGHFLDADGQILGSFPVRAENAG